MRVFFFNLSSADFIILLNTGTWEVQFIGYKLDDRFLQKKKSLVLGPEI